MPSSAAAKRLIEVPADVWAALRLKPGAPVQWEVRGSEAVMRPAPNRVASVDEVFGMLAKHVKRAGRKPASPAEMRAAARQAAATRFVRASAKGGS